MQFVISLARLSWRWKSTVMKASWRAEWAAAQRRTVPNARLDGCLFALSSRTFPRSAQHFVDGVDADKSDVAQGRELLGHLYAAELGQPYTAECCDSVQHLACNSTWKFVTEGICLLADVLRVRRITVQLSRVMKYYWRHSASMEVWN